MHLINAISAHKEDKMQMKKHKTSTQITAAVSTNLNLASGQNVKVQSLKYFLKVAIVNVYFGL